MKAELWRVHRLGDKPRHTWDEAALRWLQECHEKKSIADDRAKLRRLTAVWRGKHLHELTREEIGARIAEMEGIMPATRNRYLALVRAILRRAEREWGWLDKAPTVAMHKEAKRRIRWLTKEQAGRLLNELPPHQRDMALFALCTGLRQGNILGLRWSQIDMQRHVAWVHGDQSKNGRSIGVPLNDTAIQVLRQQVGNHPEFVFVYEGKPISKANTRAWGQALKRAGITDFRWHDLRHCWASWLVQAGTPLAALQEMGGWESAEMVRRYAHLSPDHLASHARAIDEKLVIPTTYKEKGPSRERA
ncbi:site-specific integrase [Chitiniphilus shinanonensis]